MSVISKLQIVLEANTTAFDRNLAKVNDTLAKFSKSTGEMHKKMDKFARVHRDALQGLQSAGQAAAVGLGVMAYGIKGAVDEAVKFESAMAGVKKVVDFDTPEAFKAMEQDIIALSQRLPMTAEGLANIMASAGQAGIAQADLARFTETAAKMGTAFDISAEQAGQAMAEMRVAFNMSQSEVETLADKINYLGNTSPNNAAKIMQITQAVGAVAELGGFAADQTAALASVIVGIDPSNVATGLKNISLQLTAGENATKSQRVAFEKLGLSAENVAKKMKEDAVGTLMEITRLISETIPEHEQSAVSTMLVGREALPVFAQLIQNQEVAIQKLTDMGDASKYAGSMMKEFESMAGTSQAQMQVFNNNITAVKIALGSAFLPTINSVMQALTPMLQAFTEWASANPQMVATITAITAGALGLVAVLGGLALAFTAVTGGIGSVIAMGKMVAVIVAPVINLLGFVKMFGSALAMLGFPVTAVIAGITTLIAVSVLLYKNWDTVKAKATELWQALPQMANNAWLAVQSAWSGVVSWFGGVWDSIKQSFMTWLGGMPQPVQDMVANIGTIFNTLVSVAQTVWDSVIATAKWVSDGIVSAWQGLVSTVSAIWGEVKSVITAVIDSLTPIAKAGFEIFSSVAKAQFTAVKMVIGVVFEAIKAYLSAWVNSAKAIFTAGITVFASVFNAGFALIKNAFTTAFNVIKALVRGDMQGVANAIRTGLTNAVGIIRSMVGNIVGAFRNLGGQLLQAGIDAIQGLINGIGSKFQAVREKVSQIAGLIPDGVRRLLDIRSPSRVMRELGAWAGEGFVLGVGDKVGDVKQVAENLANALTSTVADLHRQHFMLKNHANPLADLDYKLQFGELADLTDKQKARVLELARANLDLAKSNDINKSISDEIASIDEKLQTHGMNRLEILQWQIANTEKYQGANEELLATLKNQIQVESELNQLFKTREKLKGYQDSLAKNTYLYRTKGDKYAGERWDLSQQGFDGKYIDQMIETLRQSDVMSAMANMPKTLTMPTLQNNNVGSAVGSAVTGYFDLKKQLDDNLAIIKEAENAKLITEQESQLARLEQEKAFHEVRQNLVMAGADNILGSMANTTKAMLGEQSSAYRAMFALQQSFAIGTAIVNIHKAISDAFAEGTTLVQKFAGVATATTQGMKIVSAIQQIRNPVIGQAHDGIMSVPKSGTWNLEKGERVLPKHTAQNLDNTLNRLQGRGETKVIINNYTSEKAEVQKNENGDIMVVIGKVIDAKINQRFMNARRQGGELYGR
ncbi:phage tail tape measure protein [Moraxella equi]|uniref:Phage tail tape measure protein n=1 Tax=Moraxella equi TaxID=60442 RepID=A0A378QQC7_9GAMM|nr:phage tail tape measure protein [Moraxella equi]OPH38227.1 phage tail tape measure protein [Moraxella equi]STZ03106.1 Phage-related minor tail protein [Moraxella equi]